MSSSLHILGLHRKAACAEMENVTAAQMIGDRIEVFNSGRGYSSLRFDLFDHRHQQVGLQLLATPAARR